MLNRSVITWAFTVFMIGVAILGYSCSKTNHPKTATNDVVKWADYNEGMQQAAQQGKHVLLYFWRPGCVWCSKMESTNYSDTSVANLVNQMFIPIKINGWSKDKFQTASGELSGVELSDQYQLTGYPAVWFLESDGSKINVLPGYAEPDIFKLLLKYVGENQYKRTTFKDYARESGRVF